MPMRSLLAVLMLSLALPATAELRRFEIDPVHTRIMFSCEHLGFSHALGTFSHPTGELWFDPDDWSSARLEVSIDISSLDLGDDDWNERMHKRDFFHLKKYPQARFVSTSVQAIGADRARVSGELSLRGVTRPLELEVKLNRLARHGYTLKMTAGFSATATLLRADFGMDALQKVVGTEVQLRIEAEAIRKRDDGKDE